MAPTPTELAVSFSAAWLLKYVLQRYLALRVVKKDLDVCPGGTVLWLHPFRSMALLVGGWFPFKWQIGTYLGGFDTFAKYGSTCLSSVVFWSGTKAFWLADGDAIKAVQGNRAIFPKEVEAYEVINIYGPNLVGIEGADWKRHRGVANSAFNETNNALVWKETFCVVSEWFSVIDSSASGQGSSTVDLLTDLTRVALMVISSAGFSRKTSFKDEAEAHPPPGHKYTFSHALHSTLKHLLAKALVPPWMVSLCSHVPIPYLSAFIETTTSCFESLRLHMLDVISSARAVISDGTTNGVNVLDAALLKNLVTANLSAEGDGRHLTDEELLSNTFTYLLAGHETSAHTLCFAIAHLALYPEVQERVYEEVVRLWPDGVPSPEDPTPYKESMAHLEYTAAVFHEVLRFFPAVPRLAKLVQADTTVSARTFSSTKTTEGKTVVKDVQQIEVPLKTGSLVLVDIMGCQMNPIHWGDDVHEFKPERFIDTDNYRWPRHAFYAFSGGARSCIGQRFATTESVCILAQIVRTYKLLAPEGLREKSWDEQKRVLLSWTPYITLVPLGAHVEFKRR